MTATFLALLIIAWIAVFLPAALRARHSTPLSTTNRWRRRSAIMAPNGIQGRWIIVPRSDQDDDVPNTYYRSQRQRRHLFVFLVVATLVSGALAIVLRTTSVWEVHLAFDASLALYVLLLIRAKKERSERAGKVRTLRRESAPSDDGRLNDAVGYFANRRS